jgi:hypothetical protein
MVIYRAMFRVADTDEAAFANISILPPRISLVDQNKGIAEGVLQSGYYGGDAVAQRQRTSRRELADRIALGQVIVGGPDTVLEQVRRIRDELGAGVLDLVVGAQLGERTLHSIELFGANVLPRMQIKLVSVSCNGPTSWCTTRQFPDEGVPSLSPGSFHMTGDVADRRCCGAERSGVPFHHSPSHAKGSLGGDRSDDRQWDSVCKRGLVSPPPLSGCQPAADPSSFCLRRAQVKKGNASTAADPCLLSALLGKKSPSQIARSGPRMWLDDATRLFGIDWLCAAKRA